MAEAAMRVFWKQNWQSYILYNTENTEEIKNHDRRGCEFVLQLAKPCVTVPDCYWRGFQVKGDKEAEGLLWIWVSSPIYSGPLLPSFVQYFLWRVLQNCTKHNGIFIAVPVIFTNHSYLLFPISLCWIHNLFNLQLFGATSWFSSFANKRRDILNSRVPVGVIELTWTTFI